MKRTINYLFAALTLFAAASCTKDIQPDELNDGQSGLRTIELSFEDSGITKVGVSDRTPQWEAGDKVWISNGTNNEEITLAAADITSNVAKISTSLSGTLYAVYPASAQNGVSDGKIGFKIPTSTDGAFGNAHISVAEGTTSLTFKNVVSILKITTEAATKLVNISSASAIAGEFKVTYSTRNVEAGTTQAKGINITSSAAGEKYVAVASGVAFNALEFTAVKAATNWATKKSAQTSITGINTIYDMGSVSSWELSYVTNGSLWAKFSVASGKPVRFSKGNLYCTTSSSVTYSFESYQYDYRHYNGLTNDAAVIEGSSTTTPSNTVGSFFFSLDESAAYAFDYDDYSRAVADKFFTNDQTTETNPNSGLMVNGSTGLWRALSSAEWTHLLNTRTGNRFAKANVNGVKGLIIFPDGYTTVPSDAGIAVVNTTNAAFPSSSIASATWTSMESAGCVFLPAAGYRSNDETKKVCHVGSYGRFWSSTPNSSANNSAYSLYFNEINVFPDNDDYRYIGYPVRLVCAAP